MHAQTHNQSLVSVIIPTYNRVLLIEETIDSVLAQTHTNFEIIIVDDGSTDNTEGLISRLSDHRIRYFKIAHSGSFGVVRNFGIRQARGEYIAFLDSDDLWEKDKLASQVTALSDPNTDFCFTQVFLFGDTEVKVPNYPSLRGKLLNHYLLEGHFAYYPSSLMFRRQALQIIGFLNETVPYGADPEFFVNLCHHLNGIFLSRPLTKIRKHPQNTSTRDPLFSCPEMIALLKNIRHKGFISRQVFKEAISKFYYKMGLIEKDRRHVISSSRYFLSYIYHRPFHYKGWLRILQAPLQVFVPKEFSESK